MTGRPKGMAPFPSREEVLAFVRESPGPVGKREIVQAFRLEESDRRELKHLLRELEANGAISRDRGRRVGLPGHLPPVTVVRVVSTDPDGTVVAEPQTWDGEGAAPRILMQPERRGAPALGTGNRVLARLERVGEGLYQGRTIRKLDEETPRLLGLFHGDANGGWLEGVERKSRDNEFTVAANDVNGAEDGELVLAEPVRGPRHSARRVRVIERLGSMNTPRAASLIAIHAHGLEVSFPPAALEEAARATIPTLGAREDLRALPLVTIDGEDARDFDDAVWAARDEEHQGGERQGGWRLVVAIADVAHYVRPDSALDRTAFSRGNSVYFPDRVIPMLPEALSNGLCSLKPGEDRACLAVHMRIDAHGQLTEKRFARALMRSVARLTYTQVQDARDGRTDETTAPLLVPVIEPLYGAFACLVAARERRGTLELDLPERQVKLDDEGHVTALVVRPRYDSHRLVEEFMIAANVAAAETLLGNGAPCLFRIHDRPSEEKLETLRQYCGSLGLSMPRGHGGRPEHFGRLMTQAEGRVDMRSLSEVILRCQSQAEYSPDNIGHFGLALRHYAHFTSPIRRYADLVVHRALVRFADLPGKESGLDDASGGQLNRIGSHISRMERKAASAERDAVDRYTAAFLVDRVGATFAGRIAGVTRFGLFVRLHETGADGFIPVSTLPDDRYHHDPGTHALIGERRRKVFALGAEVEVRLEEANPVNGSTLLSLVSITSEKDAKTRTTPTPRRPPSHGKGATGRKKRH